MTDREPGTLAHRFRRHAAALESGGRSPLCVALMRGAAADLDEAGGVVAAAFDGDPAPPGSVPQLRLLAALHHLVLSGAAPALARHYASAGGTEPPADAWHAARAALADHAEAVRARIGLTVQTNEPGRSAALYGALLWLTERHGLPVRLLEIGASAGLNLRADRFAYVVDGETLGDPGAALVLREPWVGTPVERPAAAAAALDVVERAGCDPTPIDAATPEGRRTLLSYVWPDEPDRLARQRAALVVAAATPVTIERTEDTAGWLAHRLHDARAPGALTVVWQSVVRQYVPDPEWVAIDATIAAALGRPDAPVAWVSFEPGADHVGGFALRCRGNEPAVGDLGCALSCREDDDRLLARCGDHGPPVAWWPTQLAPARGAPRRRP